VKIEISFYSKFLINLVFQLCKYANLIILIKFYYIYLTFQTFHYNK